MLFPIDQDLTVLLKHCLALDDIDLVLLHQSGDAITHLIHHSIFVSMSLGEIKAQSIHTHSKNGAVLGMVIGLGGLKQSLGGHTSFIEADTSELFLFHQQGLETRTSGFLGSDVPSRSCLLYTSPSPRD